jgi:thiol-disulfide isomerase/thioredoxin
LAGCGNPARTPAVGSRLPPLALAHLDGGSVSSREFAGRALVINFWATWCPPCRAEMPSLQRLSELFPESDLAVMGITVDDDLNLVREFLRQEKISFTVLAQTRAAPAAARLGIDAYPTTLLVGRDGRIAAVVTGGRNWAGAAQVAEIERLLGVKRSGRSSD